MRAERRLPCEDSAHLPGQRPPARAGGGQEAWGGVSPASRLRAARARHRRATAGDAARARGRPGRWLKADVARGGGGIMLPGQVAPRTSMAKTQGGQKPPAVMKADITSRLFPSIFD